MKIEGYTCKACGGFAFARAWFDFRSCSCGLVEVGYGRYIQDDKLVCDLVSEVEVIADSAEMEIDVTWNELYNDYNLSTTDQYSDESKY